MSDVATYWKRCSSCKNTIGFSTAYWVCSVSTCTRKRTGMVFCSVSCWEVHLPMMRHREAYAVEERSPSRARWAEENRDSGVAHDDPARSTEQATSGPRPSSSDGPVVRRRVVEAPAPARAAAPDAASTGEEPDDDDLPQDILVVASKLKKYIRERAGMNTSDSVMAVLSDHLRALCNEAIRNAAKDGRKTVLDRDIPRL